MEKIGADWNASISVAIINSAGQHIFQWGRRNRDNNVKQKWTETYIEISSLVNTWHPNFDGVPLPVWSSFRVPLEIIFSTNLRYIYPLCFSKINFGRREKFSKLVEFRLPLDFAAVLSKWVLFFWILYTNISHKRISNIVFH